MILNLNNKIKDSQSFFKNVQEEKIHKIEISMKNVAFLEADGMNQFIQRLSKFVNSTQFTLHLQNQKISDDCFEQLSLSIQKMEKLESFTLNSTNTKISQNQMDSLFSSVGGHSFIQFVNIKINQYKNQNEQQQISVFKHFEHANNLKNFQFAIEEGQKGYSGQYIYQGETNKLRINPESCEIEESEFKHFHQFILNRNGIKEFLLFSYQTNLSVSDVEYIFKSLASVPSLENIHLEIKRKTFALEDYLFQIKYLQQSKQLKSLQCQLTDTLNYDKYGNIEYNSDLNQIQISLNGTQIQENNAESLSQFIKSFEELKKLKIKFETVEIQPKQLGILLSFLRGHSSIKDLTFNFSHKQINSEQLLALTQELKQSKSLENLDIILDRTELDEQGNDILSQQLSQLENIKTLKYEPLFNKIDISTSFINEISKNQSLQELQITLCHLENHQNYQESMKKLLSMHSLKNLTLYFYISLTHEVDFFKNLAEIQQTNLQHLKIVLNSELCQEKQNMFFANLGKQLSSQTVIHNITIEVCNVNDFGASVEFFKNLNQTEFYTFNFTFNNYNRYYFGDSLNKLKFNCYKKLQKVVNLIFN